MKNKLLIYYIMLVSLLTTIYTEAWAWQIKKPVDAVLNKCQSYDFCWDKYNNNTDRYVIRLYYKLLPYTIAGVKNNTGELLQETWTNTESWAWGTLDKCVDGFTVPKNWSEDGEIRIEVEAQKWVFRLFSPSGYVTQDVTEKIYSIDGPSLGRPQPQTIISCKPKKQQIDVIPSNNSNQIRWYDAFTGGNLVKEGSSFQYEYQPGLTVWYVCEAAKSGDCDFEGTRSPIAVMTFPDNIAALPIEEHSIDPEPDARMQEASCSRPGTYHELTSNIGINVSIPNPNLPGVSFSSSNTLSAWKDAQYYSRVGSSDRVCNTHLPVGAGTSRTYYQDLQLAASWTVRNPITNEVMLSGSAHCGIPNYRSARVSKSRICNPNYTTDILNIYGNNTDCGLNLQELSICPGDNALSIGPSASTYNDFGGTGSTTYPKVSYAFEWSSDQPNRDGMSGSRSKNPSIDYSGLNLPNGYRYVKYTCKITKMTQALPTAAIKPDSREEKFCVILYKCPDCPDGNKPAHEEEYPVDEKTNLSPFQDLSFRLYPNPASNELTIRYSSTDTDKEVLLKIFDLLGRPVKSILLHSESSNIDISELPKGSYMATLFKGDKKINTQLFLVNK